VDLCGFGDLVCPGGVFPAGLVGAGELLAVAVTVAVRDGDAPGDGEPPTLGVAVPGVPPAWFWPPAWPADPDRPGSGEWPGACVDALPVLD
jgi:hypothetical protein